FIIVSVWRTSSCILKPRVILGALAFLKYSRPCVFLISRTAPTQAKTGLEWATLQVFVSRDLLDPRRGRLAPSLCSVGVEQPWKSPSVFRAPGDPRGRVRVSGESFPPESVKTGS